MYLPYGMNINENNHITINGFDICEIADEYKTPLYIMNEEGIRRNCRLFKKTLNQCYENNKILFASKAFSCMYMYKILSEENLGADVVSGGELYTALKAGFNPADLYFHGNCKTDDELKLAISENIGRIVADNKEELIRINNYAKEAGIVQKISFRIKPGIDAHTHSSIMTGQIDSKFGFALENGEAEEIITTALSLENVEVSGVHCHIGSQIFDIEPYLKAVEVMINFISLIKDKTGYEIKELNLGGGFGIKYEESDNPPPYNDFMQQIASKIKEEVKKHSLSLPCLVFEPGRSIVGETGVTVYKVGAVKDIRNVRKYVMIDGGMTDNPRYALYQSVYRAILANKANEAASEKVTVAGKCCESGDLIGKDMMLPEATAGDYLMVFSTGAYNYSMASNYNRIPKLPVIMVNSDSHKIIVKRETYEDIIKNDIL